MSTWIWLLLVMILLIRGNHANIRADRWRKDAQRLNDALALHLAGKTAEAELTSGPSRADRVNEKLRDRCLALEKQNTELQSELNKRDRMIQKPKVKQKRQAI